MKNSLHSRVSRASSVSRALSNPFRGTLAPSTRVVTAPASRSAHSMPQRACAAVLAAIVNLSGLTGLAASTRVSAQVVVAPGVTASRAPVIAISNGITVVNIAAPNANGLSHNQYQQFNVGASGLVLNNSLGAATSRLAGAL